MAIEFHPIRINHRDALWGFAQIQSPASLVGEESLKLSALQIGQGWGEIATEGKDWLGYYFILPHFLECELIHLFVRHELLEQEVAHQIVRQAVLSVKRAGFHDELIAKVSADLDSVFQQVGFFDFSKNEGQIALSCSGLPNGNWKKIKVL
jgi:hypothetical protein